MKSCLIILIWITTATILLANPDTISGKVVWVEDGDTILVQTNKNESIPIQLAHIDAPELQQAFGNDARFFLIKHLNKKWVTIKILSKDTPIGYVGEVYIEGESINQLMVSEGYAWWYKSQSNSPVYGRLQIKAKAKRKGLWEDKHPTPPWLFRVPHNL